MQPEPARARSELAITLDVVPSAVVDARDGDVYVVSWQGVIRLSREGTARPIGDPPSIVPVPIAPIVAPRAMLIDDCERIVVAGGAREEAVVLRLLPDGRLDASFGCEGIVGLGKGLVRAIEIDGRSILVLGSAGSTPLVVRLGEDGARVATSGLRPTAAGGPSSDRLPTPKVSSDHCPVILSSGTIIIACRHDFEREGSSTPYAAELAAVIIDPSGVTSRIRRVAPNLHVTDVTDACTIDDGSVVVAERTLAGLRVTKLAPRHYAVDPAYGSGGHVHVLRSSDEEITWGPIVRPAGPERFAVAWSFERALTGLEHTIVAILDARTGRRMKSYAQVGLRASALAVTRDGALLIAGATSAPGQPGRIELVSL
jgi:hypothetical protein